MMMNLTINKKLDRVTAIIFALLTLTFLYLMTREAFFEWAFRRHQNQLSWYFRPLFLIPFCYFAYRRSLAGIMISLFALLTSMFWFPQPEVVSEQVKEFLSFERQYLTTNWNSAKILLTTTVPISLSLLAMAFWKRNLWFGVTVIVLMAVGKLIWSVYNAGDAGMSILVPALIGLVICSLLVVLGFRRMQAR
jgi:hypothetical protein